MTDKIIEGFIAPSNEAFLVASQRDLVELKQRSGLSEVRVDLAKLKSTGLSRMALRSAFFAVARGGRIVVTDASASAEQSVRPYKIGWPTLRALAITTLARGCSIEVNPARNELCFTRVAPPLAQGWSAGLIFSGRDVELPEIFRSLDGLCAQPELSPGRGEILLCGPTRDLSFLSRYPQVDYLPYDLPEGVTGFPISLKKNFLLSRMRYPRRLILHARITLEPGALAKAPSEFDILSPNIIHRSARGIEENIGLVVVDPRWPDLPPRQFERSTLDVTATDYLKLFRHGRPYVDGGAFAVTKTVFDVCPLHDSLGWGDCEDVEWCIRAQAMGFLVDLCPQMNAVNSVSKAYTLEYLPRWLAHSVRRANRGRRFLMDLAKGKFSVS